ncbi:AAA family ATPase [Streptomyces boninensis]|uniref:AAA family ATPase n=1 Tax=Streptomyces boninensis TaxID=2039455 RepID=UPI003B21791E
MTATPESEPRPGLTELRLSAFKSHRGATLPVSPLTVLTGASGSGKSSALQACRVLARLGGGALLAEAFGLVTGGAGACVPYGAQADPQGRRGFRIGCTVDGPAGEVRLDVAVQAEPELRVVGERLTGDGQVLFSTALRDPGRPRVQAAWRTAGTAPVTKAPLPDNRLATAMVPLRVSGRTEGERAVLAAAEQVVVALRSVYWCDPEPAAMRDGAGAPGVSGAAELTGDCRNLGAVLGRVRAECSARHGALVQAVRAGCWGPVEDLRAEGVARGGWRAVVDRGPQYGRTPLGGLGDGELRYLALALVLLTGPGVLAVDAASEVLPARQALTVVADGLDRCLDGGQARELLELAGRMCERGHIRLLGGVSDSGVVRGIGGPGGVGSVVDLGHERGRGR